MSGYFPPYGNKKPKVPDLDPETVRRNKLIDDFVEAQYALIREADEKIGQNIKELHDSECVNKDSKCFDYFSEVMHMEIKLKIVSELKKRDPHHQSYLN
jgi:hypothetical protein